jgi:hypothetical protein
MKRFLFALMFMLLTAGFASGMDLTVTTPFQFLGTDGKPLRAGKVHTYNCGTTTNRTTYSDRSLSTANANPVVLDSNGRANIFQRGCIKLVVKTSADVTLYTWDELKTADSTKLFDDDQDTGWQVEETADEDIIRADIAGTEQLTIQDGKIEPTTDNDIDLGSDTKRFKDGYFDGDVETDGIIMRENAAPTTAANEGGLHVNVGLFGQSELYFEEESAGDSVAITQEGRLSLPRSYLAGLGTSLDTDTDHDILIAVGETRDSTNVANLILGTAITKQIDATWAAGDDAGGLFSGAVANDTTYHIFLIIKDSDGTVDAGFDTSVTAANIPTGYTYYRRIASITSDGSANITDYVQIGDRFMLLFPSGDVGVTNPGDSAVTRTLSVPTGISVLALMVAGIDDTTSAADAYWYLSDLSLQDSTPGASITHAKTGQGSSAVSDQGYAWAEVYTNTSGQIRSRATGSAADITFYINTMGWIDTRGRDD